MDYALLKQLKDAGFPQSHAVSLFKHEGAVTIPTLSELIEACGDRFYALIKDDEGWYAHEKNGGAGILGKTPEEAVAKLWLEINKS